MDFDKCENIKVEKEDGITFLAINRPEKRNAMSPGVLAEMFEALAVLEADDETEVLVITGVGESWSAGQDLREFFRAYESRPLVDRKRYMEINEGWRQHRLGMYDKPTIAMVNGYCIGGAFTQLCSCDFAIASEDATFSLSEINWGILPGGVVTWTVANTLNARDAMYYCCTGEAFDGKKAVEMGLINKAVPADKLKEEVVKLANVLRKKNPEVLRATKQAVRRVAGMDYFQALDYLAAKMAEIRMRDPEDSFHQGLTQFLDEKSYRPSFEPFKRPTSAD
jgi:trans-feruloyl-CoA hydratase/vanillin synthase